MLPKSGRSKKKDWSNRKGSQKRNEKKKAGRGEISRRFNVCHSDTDQHMG